MSPALRGNGKRYRGGRRAQIVGMNFGKEEKDQKRARSGEVKRVFGRELGSHAGSRVY